MSIEQEAFGGRMAESYRERGIGGLHRGLFSPSGFLYVIPEKTPIPTARIVSRSKFRKLAAYSSNRFYKQEIDDAEKYLLISCFHYRHTKELGIT
jgi:hypothetical protein